LPRKIDGKVTAVTEHTRLYLGWLVLNFLADIDANALVEKEKFDLRYHIAMQN